MKLKRIRTKLLIMNITLTAVLLIGLTLAGYAISSNAMIRYATSASSDLTSQIGANVRQELETIASRQYQELSYNSIANALSEKSGSSEDVLLMHRFSTFLSFFSTLEFCSDNFVLATDGTTYMTPSYLMPDYLDATATPPAFITEYFSPPPQESVPGRDHWVVSPDGKLYLWRTLVALENHFQKSGIHVAEIDMEYLAESCGIDHMNIQQDIFLIDSEWRPVFPANTASNDILPLLRSLHETGHALSDLFSPLRFDHSGGPYLLQTAPLSGTELYLFSVTPVRALLTESQFLLYMFLLIGGFAIFLSVICTIFATSAMTRNIRLLTESIHEFSLNKFTPIPVPHQQDEITDVILEFNRMGEKVIDLLEEIYYAELRHQSQKLKALQFEYSALQAKIDPHFLYNTLETISSMAKLDGAKDVSEAVCMLGSLLRQNTRTDQKYVTLSQEIDYTRCYLELYHLNLGDRLSIQWDVPEELFQIAVPRLILQPVVENSIKHGFTDQLGEWLIRVKASRCGNDLILSVTDNGRGIPEAVLNTILHEQITVDTLSDHIGIASVHKRIQILYGDPYGVSIKSVPFEATTIALSFPALPYEEESLDV